MDKLEKLIQEKIKNYKPTIQEADWMAMEKLLDERSKKGSPLPWWKYGIAAAGIIGLLFTTAIYKQTHLNQYSSNKMLLSQEERSTSKINFKKKTTNFLKATNVIQPTSEEEMDMVKNKKLASNHASKSHNNQAVFAPNSSSKNNLTEANTPTTNNIKTNSYQDFLGLSRMNLTLDNETSFNFKEEKQEEFELKKHSKRLVHFAIGVDFGALASIKLENTVNSKSVSIYSDVISDAGLNFQVIFKNTIGFYTGLKYADRQSFTTPDPMTVGTNNVLLSSKSKIEGINIPVGIYLNLLDQKYCSIFTKIGINNILPLRENMNYETIDRAVVAPVENATNIGNTKLISTTDNNLGIDKKDLSYSNSLNTSSNEPIQHNIKKKPNEKYLGEFQLSIGAKIKASNHLAFTIEPAYLLDFKNAHRMENTSNFTFNTGVLYTF